MTHASTPAKLYALLLKLRPCERGTLMPFSGELVHGAWLNWIREAAPDIATLLHSGNQRRLFTCSSLQFPISEARVRQAQRENIHLPLDPEKIYTVRITFLISELYPLFYHTLMTSYLGVPGAKRQPFMQIGKQSFWLEEVIADPENASDWTGFTTFTALVGQTQQQQSSAFARLTLVFASLTTFNWIHVPNKIYGNHYELLPLPRYIFPGLAKRWQELAPPELGHIVQKERIEAYVDAHGIVIDDYTLHPHCVHFVEHPQRGFVGTCTYLLRGPDEAVTDEAPLTVRQQLWLLAHFAFYTGVGYKPTMGMGQIRPILRGHH